MKILLSWLCDYVETGLSAVEIADILSDLGLPYDRIETIDGDAVIDVEVTSNRGDCLSYIGIARELAAATGKELRIPAVKLKESQKDVTELASVEIAEANLCSRYTARIIESVKVGPSPAWLKKRLEAVGMRSVNNVVDATNYAMLETGQPPHAFDYDKIADGKIIVRKALAGERIVSIDGSKCDLDPNMLIIADSRRPVAIAGIMGSLDTEVGEGTKTILLEDAYFDPVSVRTTSRRLGLPSEAAFRFERIVDIEQIDWASKRAAELITQVTGGKVAKGIIDVYPGRPSQKQVTLRLSRLNKLLGVEIPPKEVVTILSRLKFNPQQKDDSSRRPGYGALRRDERLAEPERDSIICTVPSWRSDIYREVDLIEEVTRVHGYNRIPMHRKIQIEVVPADARQKLTQAVGTYLNGCGFYETISVGFIDGSVAEFFTAFDVKQHLTVKDESRKSANLLRQMLLGSLLGVLKTNLNVGNSPCRIFEIADTFVPTAEDAALPIEKTRLALVCDSNFQDLRGVVEGLITNINRDAQVVFAPAEQPWAQTAAEVMVNGSRIGLAGIILDALRDKFDFEDVTACAAELEFEALLALQSGELKAKPIPRFPAIVRDLSLIVDERVRWADIVKAVSKKASAELEQTCFVGIYRGKAIPSGKKSVTLSLRFRDADGTLTHESVDRLEADIVAELTASVGAELRTA